MPKKTTEEYFSRVALPSVCEAESEGKTLESELLRTIQRALQHHEVPSQILGSRSQTSPDGVTVEELAWGRLNIVWTLGGRVRRHWAFPEDHEEIRAVCWAYFEDKSTRRTPESFNQPAPTQAIFQEGPPSVFGPYAQKMRQKAHRPSTIATTSSEDGPYGPGTGAMARAICIIFRTFAQIQLEDGNEYCVHVPFITRQVWPLFPVGFALEQESPQDISLWRRPPLGAEPILYSLSSPLRSIAPYGVAHQIRNTSAGPSLIYQDDLPHPNRDLNTFSSLNNGERVIFVDPYSSSSARIIFTIDTRLMSIHCYVYSYAPAERASADSILLSDGVISPPSPGGPLFGTAAQFRTTDPPSNVDAIIPSNLQTSAVNPKPSSQWLMENTSPLPSWRDSRPRADDDEFDLNAQMSVMNSVLIDLQDEDEEEIVGPDHWLQNLASIPVDQETYVDVLFGPCDLMRATVLQSGIPYALSTLMRVTN